MRTDDPSSGARAQPGLRLRLAHEARRIAAQHGALGALERSTLRALERTTPVEAREALQGFRGALEAHFTLEEQVHFPALHGLRPELAPELDALASAHTRLRAAAVELDGRVGREPRDHVTRAFRALTDDLHRHEAEEERLLLREADHREG